MVVQSLKQIFFWVPILRPATNRSNIGVHIVVVSHLGMHTLHVGGGWSSTQVEYERNLELVHWKLKLWTM